MINYNRNPYKNQREEVPTTGGQTDWQGCYDDGWKGIITDESFAHP